MSQVLVLRLRYFASIRETLGTPEEEVHSGASDVGALRDELLSRGGGYAEALGRHRPVRMALNQVLCDESALLRDGDELAFFPPVTGG